MTVTLFWSSMVSLLFAFNGATFWPMVVGSLVIGLAITGIQSILHWATGENSNQTMVPLKLSDEGWNSEHVN